ncbi:hypothetical protein [Streptomyces sp. MST-110588]|uniref:hypothetical protein n=1 Tax=Streptomyces sp. MST-110588 TaxID=2833628 RepID=UPI001F5DDD0A|nr:hypothetical protein [Streptomyces sp. MST-110588]UNO44419.1 hypothetical protein KGS77_01700 [Streptomyces sp. MST-110588]
MSRQPSCRSAATDRRPNGDRRTDRPGGRRFFQEKGILRYRWTLKPGRSLPEGQHVFAAQYDHAEGARDARGGQVRDHVPGRDAPYSPYAVGGGFGTGTQP